MDKCILLYKAKTPQQLLSLQVISDCLLLYMTAPLCCITSETVMQTRGSEASHLWGSQYAYNICMTFIQRQPDVGPTLYKCYTNVLCLLGCLWDYQQIKFTRWAIKNDKEGCIMTGACAVKWQQIFKTSCFSFPPPVFCFAKLDDSNCILKKLLPFDFARQYCLRYFHNCHSSQRINYSFM